ncbi:MAG: MBL fold metallo-hydrolase [Desulfosalsimonas sp.]
MKETSCPKTLSICVLASGSKGNCIYIKSNKTAILFDAGLSGIQLEHRMKQRDICPKSLDAIVVSHEHSDHITGVGVLSRRYGLPVHINPATQKAIPEQLGRIGKLRSFERGLCFRINELVIRPFSVSHDAAQPAAFTVESGGMKIGIATDLGFAPNMVKQHLKNCDLLVLEANHDYAMLEQGPYPWPVKQRIKSRTGHLSNETARDLLMEVMGERLKHVILAHLSEANNTPEKALSVVSEPAAGRCLNFSVAHQHLCGELIRIRP